MGDDEQWKGGVLSRGGINCRGWGMRGYKQQLLFKEEVCIISREYFHLVALLY
jgi:hypothetical protein